MFFILNFVAKYGYIWYNILIKNGVVCLFGYIRPDMGELKTKHVGLYRSVYCGICRCSGKHISRFSRFLLNYDFVFLAVVRLALTGEKFVIKPRRCMANLKKRGVMEPNEALKFTSAAFGALAYFKALDDIYDEKGFKRFYTRAFLPFFRRMAKKAEKMYPGIGDTVKEPLERLSKLEKEKCAVPDEVADCFAVLTANVASFGMEGATARVAKDIGYHIGRFVYLADALDDRYKDQKTQSYNPLNLSFGGTEGVDQNISFLRRTLLDSGAAISRSYALADGNSFDGIIYNIAGYGIEAAAEKVINKENSK